MLSRNRLIGFDRYCGEAPGRDYQQGGGAERPPRARERVEDHVRAPHSAE